MSIFVEYWVDCDQCGASIVLVEAPVPRTKAEAAAQAVVEYGWKKRKGQWLCPNCQEQP